ncbi:hypothetical protein APHNP_0290 [Anaplasma phagocytophilum str. ApNP]|uniref:Uncharacterized protein n=1 Tax=Anaplasma phagocytophilum str. ApNP TaxID=1359153 RepID=A0A0F3NII4_ANAPH|nr:hypothetical protein APHNP_0290 [Anaplasma phagocytophilum str. ApNP]
MGSKALAYSMNFVIISRTRNKLLTLNSSGILGHFAKNPKKFCPAQKKY